MATPQDYHAISDWLRSHGRPVLFSHQRPDGDALGAMVGVCHGVRALGGTPTALLFEDPPARYPSLKSAERWGRWEGAAAGPAAIADGVIILDTCSFSQLEPLRDWLPTAPPTLVIDHHATRDAIATRPGDLRVADVGASATCLLVAEWLASAEIALDPRSAAALFTGIATDTGWFRFPNTDARTLRAAAALVEAGAPVANLYAEIYQQDSPARLRLIGRLLASLELRAGERLAVMKLRHADFAATGADVSMTEDLVNEAGRLATTEATILFVEQPDGVIRVNLRSKRTLDVAALARQFGGGGHARAAGARLTGSWDAETARVVSATEAAIGST